MCGFPHGTAPWSEITNPIDDLATRRYEPQGNLYSADSQLRTALVQGWFQDFQKARARAVRTGIASLVSAEAGTITLAVLDAARQTAHEGKSDSL